MRMRTELVLPVAAVLALAIFMNQAPTVLVNSSSSPPTEDQTDGSSVADSSSPDLANELASICPAVPLVASEFIRKTRTPPTNGQIFAPARTYEIVPRRDQLMIMVDILVFAHRPATRKGIIKNLNMSQLQLRRYLRFLLEKGFIVEERAQGRTYRVTEKGAEFVRLLED